MTVKLRLLLLVVVALRKESVDRNDKSMEYISQTQVALRKESVDRNDWPVQNAPIQAESLSARRAWIEIAARRPSALRNTRRSPQGERG